MNSRTDLYARAGIASEAEFYRTKFVSDEVLDARYFNPLNRFDIRFARTMWVYDNVAEGSQVLDLGCGAGMLALLKRKGVILTGVDLSSECAIAGRRNDYDLTCTARLNALPFRDAAFDYVVSLDVLGHVAFEKKDEVLAEIKRVLRPGGVTLHGIECIDRIAQKDYQEMSPEELRRFIHVDGHVGLEEELDHEARFKRFFEYTQSEPRYALTLSSEEFIKQADYYNLPFEEDFLDYLRNLSFKERRAFDIAMGYVFNKISDLNITLPRSGLYLFLKASTQPLGPFYNEHRDRTALFQPNSTYDRSGSVSLDRDARAIFDDGWYEPNDLPPIARWMGARSRLRFKAGSLSKIQLDLITHIPDLETDPLELEFWLNGHRIHTCQVRSRNWTELTLDLPNELRSVAAKSEGEWEMEIRANRTWQPRPYGFEDRDDRELSVAICNIEIFPSRQRSTNVHEAPFSRWEKGWG